MGISPRGSIHGTALSALVAESCVGMRAGAVFVPADSPQTGRRRVRRRRFLPSLDAELDSLVLLPIRNIWQPKPLPIRGPLVPAPIGSPQPAGTYARLPIQIGSLDEAIYSITMLGPLLLLIRL